MILSNRLKRFGRFLYQGFYSIGEGMASIGEGMAGMFGYYDSKTRIPSDEEAWKKDSDSLRKDFEVVGKDLEDAIKKFRS